MLVQRLHVISMEEHLKMNENKLNIPSKYPLEFSTFSTHPAFQLLLDEWLEQCPDHVEEEGLLNYVHLLQSQGHRLLDEGEKTRGELRREGSDLFHRESVKVHNHHHATDLGDQFELGGQMDQVKDAEQLIRADFLGIPWSAAVHNEHATSLVIEVGQDVNNVVLYESPTLLLRHDALKQLYVVLLEFGNFAHLQEEDNAVRFGQFSWSRAI